MRNQFDHVRVTLPSLLILMILGGVLLSLYACDPHWLSRSGALISAVAAGAILLQIKAELQLEAEREHVEAQMRDIGQSDLQILPVDELAARLAASRLEMQRTKLSLRRLEVAAYVVVSAIVGELLHGFGDLLMCYVFSVCARH